MSSDYRKNSEALVGYLGGSDNISSVTNCMTRLRVVVKDDSTVNDQQIRSMDDVMELVHDRAYAYEIVVGPGKSRKYADQLHDIGFGTSAGSGTAADMVQSSKEEETDRSIKSRIRSSLKVLGDIFVPLIPGIITAGLCAGFAAIIAEVVPNYDSIKAWSLVYNLLDLVKVSLMTYLTAWAGYRAAERFGATPILGGMLGMITSLDGIDTISDLLGLYDEKVPLDSILRDGRGGVLAVIVGVFLLSIVEKKIRSRMPDSLDVILTPLLSLLICLIPYILIIMPLLGYVSSGIVWAMSHLCMSEILAVRVLAGFISAAMFLPLVATGMHHGLVALYSVELDQIGYITLYPALAMAGAGQVGASIALWIKARNVGNKNLCSVIAGALPAGFLGVGEPLIYGVTLPLGKPFITAGIGAGFGGALVMAAEVASTTWGPSGILGIFVMTAGPQGAVKSVLFYVAGLIVSYICSFIITYFAYSEQNLRPNIATAASVKASADYNSAGKAVTADYAFGEAGRNNAAEQAGTACNTAEKAVNAENADAQNSTQSSDQYSDYPVVKHGDPIMIGENDRSFKYTITDPAGIHARPAGKLAELVGKYDCKVTVSANGKTASAGSVIDLMSLGASKGTVLTVRSEGKDAQESLAAVREFIENTL